jgi:NhaP-type Na+/H+ or K+/H+ antiporter
VNETDAALGVVSGCVVVWGLVAARFERLNVTAPIAFVVLGLALTHGPVTLVHLNLRSSTIRSIAEIALALLLFVDASRVNARVMLASAALPVRLLAVGLPLTIGAGTVMAAALLRGGGWWLAALVGAIVAPTDAALGAPIMQDERVPTGVRRVLNVESGLNDGIATPFVNLFLAGALSTEAVHGAGVAHAVVDLLGGAGLGAGVGVLGALLLSLSRSRGWSSPEVVPLSVLALAVFAYECAVLAGLNGFVAAFIAGVAFGSGAPACADVLSLAEEAGSLLSLVVWFIFGAVMLVPAIRTAVWQDVVFAVLALTVVRMVPVALSLVGAGLDRATVAFIGWFGPRGLASVVFGLLAFDALAPADGKVLLSAVTVTVAMSVVLHGVTAAPLSKRYGRHAAGLHVTRPEHEPTPEISTRTFGARRAVAAAGADRSA